MNPSLVDTLKSGHTPNKDTTHQCPDYKGSTVKVTAKVDAQVQGYMNLLGAG